MLIERDGGRMGIDPGNVDTRYDRIGGVVLMGWSELLQPEIHSPFELERERGNKDEADLYNNNCCGGHTTTNVMFLFATYGARFQGGSALTSNHAHFVLFRRVTRILLLLATGRRYKEFNNVLYFLCDGLLAFIVRETRN